jgi:hypothetical protein
MKCACQDRTAFENAIPYISCCCENASSAVRLAALPKSVNVAKSYVFPKVAYADFIPVQALDTVLRYGGVRPRISDN